MALSTKRHTNNLSWFDNKKFMLPSNKKAYFLATIAELLSQGFSLNQSLQFMKLLMVKQLHLIEKVEEDLSQGLSFEKSIQPLGFSLNVIAQLFYAQRQGRFINSLIDNANRLETMDNYKSQLIKIITYPLLMGIFLLALLFGMRMFLLPQIASFISQDVYDNNALVRLLIGFFNYLPQIFIFILACALLLYLFIDFYLMRLTYIKRYQFLIKIPLVNKWFRQYTSYHLSKELGHFFFGGYSIQQVIEVLIEYPIDPFLTEVAQYMNQQFIQGISLDDMIVNLGIFTDELPLIIIQGELTSQIAQKFQIYSDAIFKELMDDLTKKLNLIQPIMFILIAVLILALYLMMMLPMLTMEGI